MKTTKEELVKENAVLNQKLEGLNAKDFEIRKELSECLDSYENVREFGYTQATQSVNVQSWLGIAYLIGELKSDADFSLNIEREKMLRQENEELRRKIHEFENPRADKECNDC